MSILKKEGSSILNTIFIKRKLLETEVQIEVSNTEYMFTQVKHEGNGKMRYLVRHRFLIKSTTIYLYYHLRSADIHLLLRRKGDNSELLI